MSPRTNLTGSMDYAVGSRREAAAGGHVGLVQEPRRDSTAKTSAGNARVAKQWMTREAEFRRALVEAEASFSTGASVTLAVTNRTRRNLARRPFERR